MGDDDPVGSGVDTCGSKGSTGSTKIAESQEESKSKEKKQPIINPVIRLRKNFVAVKFKHTNPPRQSVVLTTDNKAFGGVGTFTVSGKEIDFCSSDTKGTKLTFDGADNVFPAAQLNGSGVKLWMEGINPGDVTLTLDLSGQGNLGPAATKNVTSVKATVHLYDFDTDLSKTDPAASPLGDDVKLDPGGILDVQSNHRKPRYKVEVRVEPGSFKKKLKLEPIGKGMKVFTKKNPSESTIATEFRAEASKEFWAEGAAKSASSTAKDTGLKLLMPDLDAKKEVDKFVSSVVQLQIKPVDGKNTFDVVLKADGTPHASHKKLGFNIQGPPGWLCDVQVARKRKDKFNAGPGLANSWDKSKNPVDNAHEPAPVRLSEDTFSSYTNADSITLDGSGKGTYDMPDAWWTDLARLKRTDFDEMDVYYRVIAWAPGINWRAWSAADTDQLLPKVKLRNNLVSFKKTSESNDDAHGKKNIAHTITVRNRDTWGMYCVVQWNKGENKVKSNAGVVDFSIFTDYGLDHKADIPEWKIDRIGTDPRYHDNIPESTTSTSATFEDKAGGPIYAGDKVDFNTLDFKIRLHLNCDVEGKSVQVKVKTGSPPVYDQVIGVLPDPQAAIVAERPWKLRILQIRPAVGPVKVTHPETYAV